MSLETSYKKISAWIGNVVDTCISLVKVLFQSTFSASLPKAKEHTCIILGNGPSLKTSFAKHYDFFKKHPLICVNHFALSKEYTSLKPAYYVMLDPIMWLNDTNAEVKRTFDAIIHDTAWELHLLVPRKVKGSAFLKRIADTNPHIKVSYFNYTVFRGFRSFAHFFFRRNLAMPQSQNVLIASVFLCINMHFKKIILVGADHTWHEQLHVNEMNQVCLKNVHFYENEASVSYHPFYTDATQRETFRMDDLMFTLAKKFYGYRVLRQYADHLGTTIYNASEVSFIDAFERKKIEE